MSRKYQCEKSTAEFTGLSVKTLQRYRGTGEGPPYIKAGSRVLYDQDDVISWMNARKCQSTSAYLNEGEVTNS